MQLDSENCVDSSNNPNQNRYCMRNRRRKIYDDGDFKEVVKNFYTLISDINRIANKRIQKLPLPKNKQQQPTIQQKKFPQKKPLSQEIRKNDLYNFKKETIYQQASFQNQQQFYQQYNPQFSNPYLNPLPFVAQQQLSMRNSYNQQVPYNGSAQLRKNSSHIAIAYAIYVQNQGSEMVENRDPTMNAKKKMKENNIDSIKQLTNNQGIEQQYQEEAKEEASPKNEDVRVDQQSFN